jgi:hypothetical protein
METTLLRSLSEHGTSLSHECISALVDSFAAILVRKCESADPSMLGDFNDDFETQFFLFAITVCPDRFRAVLPLFLEMLINYNLTGSAFSIIVGYISISCDASPLPHYAEAAFRAMAKWDTLSARRAIESLGMCCEAIPCESDFVHALFDNLTAILDRKTAFENESLTFFDTALITFAKLILHHGEDFDLRHVIRLFFASLPLSTARTDSLSVTELLARLVSEAMELTCEICPPQSVGRTILAYVQMGSVPPELMAVLIESLHRLLPAELIPT